MYIAPINSNCAFYIETNDISKKKYEVIDNNGKGYGFYDSEALAIMAVTVTQNKLMAEHVKKYPPTVGLFDETKLKK